MAYIVSCSRTPTGSYQGKLASYLAIELGLIAVKDAVDKIILPKSAYEEIYFGSVIQANLGQSPAKQVAVKAGLPNTIVSTTINKVCASGMKALICGAQAIYSGHANAVITGGTESMSNAPYYVTNLRKSSRNPKFGPVTMVDGLQRDGLSDPVDGYAMGIAGEATAEKYGISRQDQDSSAIQSYRKALAATKQGKFKSEIVPVANLETDQELDRFDKEAFPNARTAFKTNGTVTAPNSSPMSDGASCIVLVSEKILKETGIVPLAKIKAFGEAEQESILFPTSPALAISKALAYTSLEMEQIDFFEINEAFAVVSEANRRILNIPESKLNVYGGAVALGHALGSSGTRILVTLVSILHQEKGHYGAAAICNGGGGASCVILERSGDTKL